jgi:hypothetical protein
MGSRLMRATKGRSQNGQREWPEKVPGSRGSQERFGGLGVYTVRGPRPPGMGSVERPSPPFCSPEAVFPFAPAVRKPHMTIAQDACERVLSLALAAVEKSARNGDAIAAHVDAVRLLDQNPDCPMSWEDLRDHIVELANARGAIVYFRDDP